MAVIKVLPPPVVALELSTVFPPVQNEVLPLIAVIALLLTMTVPTALTVPQPPVNGIL